MSTKNIIIVIIAVLLLLVGWKFLSTKNSINPYQPQMINSNMSSEEAEKVKKYNDAQVKVDVDQATSAINIYYYDTKKLPKNLEEMITLPALSFFKIKNNPNTGKPYTYIPKSDNTGFTVSGTLSNGEEYKRDIPIN